MLEFFAPGYLLLCLANYYYIKIRFYRQVEPLLFAWSNTMYQLKFRVAILAALFFSASVFAGASAKFSATIDKAHLIQASASATGNETPLDIDLDSDIDIARIKVANKKDLLIGISAQIGLLTSTSVKGKNGGGGSATAAGGVGVSVHAVPVNGGPAIVAEPGPVILSARLQELSATLGGVIESCEDTLTDNGDGTFSDGADGKITVATECIVSDEEIALLLATVAAHHHNFIVPNLDAGEYRIRARFVALAAAAATDTGDKDGTNTADATVVVGPRVTTVQEVRATNNPDGIIFE